MKKQLLLSCILLLAFGLGRANTITVDNNLGHPSNYTDIQSAITASSNGDTIYVIGSLTAYAGIQINKSLHIFGPGMLPQKANTLTAIVNGLEFQAHSDSTVVSGMQIIGGATFDGSVTLYNITLLRDNFSNGGMGFNGGGIYNGLKVISCFMGNGGVFMSPGGGIFNNYLVENCIIGNNNGPLVNGGFVSNTTIFKNNALIQNVDGGNGTYPFFGQVEQVTFSNNIFIGGEFNPTGNTNVGPSYCSFDHNIAYLMSGTYGTDPFMPGQNYSSNNLWDQNPNFVSVNLPSIHLTDDYELAAGSPCLTTASDGGQMGSYGGDPSANWALAAMPALPYIYSFILQTATVNAGGTINATVISKSHN